MTKVGTESEQEQRPVALEYAKPDADAQSNRLGRAAFTLGVFSVVAVILCSFTADDRLQNAFLRAAAVWAVGSIVAGIFGRRVARNRGGVGKVESRNGMILGAVAIALLPVVIVLSMPVCSLPREPPNRVRCQSNLRQIGQGLLLYAYDHGGQYPQTLGPLISDADLSPEVFLCPSSNEKPASGQTRQQIVADFAKSGHCSYVYLAAGMKGSSLPANFVVAYEPLDDHEKDGANFLFGDGHAEWLNAKEAANFIKQLKAGVNPPK